MGKRTSDFVALVAIVGGGGLGFGLTSLFAGAAPEVQVHDTSVEIRVVPGRVLVGTSTIYFGSVAEAYASPKGLRVVVQREPQHLEELTVVVEKVVREARELLDRTTTVNILRGGNVLGRVEIRAEPNEDEDEDERRRRRRRRPREAAEVRASGASGNR